MGFFFYHFFGQFGLQIIYLKKNLTTVRIEKNEIHRTGTFSAYPTLTW